MKKRPTPHKSNGFNKRIEYPKSVLAQSLNIKDPTSTNEYKSTLRKNVKFTKDTEALSI